jgi:NAD(P)-dependent dehydrogenase (short-subunit alcohol dehydrogenase family)
VVVAGGGSAIGREGVRSAAADGASVALPDVSQEAVDRTLEDVAAEAPDRHGLRLRVVQSEHVDTPVDRSVAEVGPVCGLVAAAGVGMFSVVNASGRHSGPHRAVERAVSSEPARAPPAVPPRRADWTGRTQASAQGNAPRI